MPHPTRTSFPSDPRSSASDKVASFLCFGARPTSPDEKTYATTNHEILDAYGRQYVRPAPRWPLQGEVSLDEASDTSSIYSRRADPITDTSTIISYPLPRMPGVERGIPPPLFSAPDTTSCPQFYILISGSFAASHTVFARRIFSNTTHPCESLSPIIQEMMEESIHSQIVDLMDRKLRDSLQLAAQTNLHVDEDYRVSFFIGTLNGMGETKSYLGRQTHLLCAEEAREITTSLETIIARQIAIFDPPANPEHNQIVDILDSKPLMLTLRFDICDCSQKILVSRLVSCRTPTYPLPPADEVRALMQRIWKNTYEIVGREKLSKRDTLRLSEEERARTPPYKFCVSFDVLFGDAEHKWFGGLCYGSRGAEFSDYTLGRLTSKVEEVFKEQLAIFGVLDSLGWPGGRNMKAGFVTTDGLEEAEMRTDLKDRGKRGIKLWGKKSASSKGSSGEVSP